MIPRTLGLILLGAVVYLAATWVGYWYLWRPHVAGSGDAIIQDKADILTARQAAFIRQYHEKLLEDHDIDYRTVTGIGDGADINTFAYTYFEEHGVGRLSESGRGLLLAIDVDDGVVRVEVSRALEGIYTDRFISYIQHRQMIPFFRSGRVADGILASTELVFMRAQEAESGRDFVPPMEAATAGAGASNPARIGAGDGGAFRDGPDVTSAGDSPRAVLAAYKKAMAKRNGNPDLSIYTSETRRFLGGWTVTPAQMDNVADSLDECRPGTLNVKADHAVLHYPISQRTCPPNFFRVEEGRWRLDLTMMGEAVRFNHRNQWHFALGYLQSEQPYTFAFSDWRIDEQGFPMTAGNAEHSKGQDRND